MPLPIAERDGHGGIMSYNLCGVKPFGRLVDYGKGQEVICRLSVYSLANKLCLEQVIRIHFKDNYRKSSCVQTDGLSPRWRGLIKVNRPITKHRSLYQRQNESVYCANMFQRSRQAVRRERSTAKGGTLHRPWQTGSRMVTTF